VLLLAIVLAYLPTFNAGFVRWDDQYYVEDSNLLPDPDGLQKIWNPFGHDTQQFYPLVFSTYWLEYRLWGLDPHSYHVVNVGLHALNALLVLFVVLELGVATPVAAATAAIFALHPAQVASVAWISELKNTLSGLFYLLAAYAYLRHRHTGAWSTYGLCLFAFVGALLSKTQTLTLPASLLLADWVLQRRNRIRRAGGAGVVARIVPMLALGGLAGLITMHFEQAPWTRTFTLLERVLISTNAAVFYARTFVAPFRLSPIYAEWQVVSTWQWWIAPVLCTLGGGVLGLGRRRIPELVTWGIAHFYIALIPVLGIFSFNFQTYTFVADHFVYLSLIGAGLAVALAVEQTAAAWPSPSSRHAIAAGAFLLLTGCAVLTYVECTHWHSNLTFWTHVRDRDPNGFLANYNLGNHYRSAGQWPEAVPFYQRAADIRPRADYPFVRYAEALGNASGAQAVINMCTQWVTRDPTFHPAYLERGIRHEQLGQLREALADYARTLQLAPRGSVQWNEAQHRRTKLAAAPAANG
jgi:protein O-mannosyl-transferase